MRDMKLYLVIGPDNEVLKIFVEPFDAQEWYENNKDVAQYIEIVATEYFGML